MRPIYFIDRATGEKVAEVPPGRRFLKFLYYNPVGGLALHALVKRKILSRLYGTQMKRRRSRRRVQPFIDNFNIDAEEFAETADSFTSFNDFFTRRLKPGSRPIGPGLVSPADGKLLAFERVDRVGNFYVKGQPFTLAKFLRNRQLAQHYRNYAMYIIRLAPSDYHRWHFPYSGHISAVTKIKGSLFSVSPYATLENFGRVFTENKREYAVLTTSKVGKILIAPVGATMVGSIIETYTPDSYVEKGEEMGYFEFGGSSIVLLVDRRYVQLDSDLLRNTAAGFETSVRMGEQIGRIRSVRTENEAE